MDAAARIEALEEANARLRERVAFLEAHLGGELLAPAEWRLTVQEARLLACIAAREMATKDALMAAMYRDEGREEPMLKIVDVFVCKARKKLKPFGIEIETVWGRGYRLAPQTRARVRAAMSGGAAHG